MLKVLTGEVSKSYKIKNRDRTIHLCINMHIKRGFIMTSDFRFTCMLLYMLIMIQCKLRTHTLLIIFLTAKKSFPGTVLKYWLGFNYIRSEDYELDKNYYGTG